MSSTIRTSTASLSVLVEDRSVQPGALLKNRYRLGQILGEGGMAQVYEATDLLGRADIYALGLVLAYAVGGRDALPLFYIAENYQQLAEVPTRNAFEVLDSKRRALD